uniref:Uncharacterized protein n=2 Tax=Arundo donax TaxID=35708 RepID=A0A0A9CPB7_ARUDO
MTAVPPRMWMDCLREFTIWNVVELSSPVEISSMKSALAGPTSISPVVTRFRCPPEMPLSISSPTIVSAHISSPNIFRI